MSASLIKYSLDAEKTGECEVPHTIVNFTSHPQVIRDYIVAMRRNARQWSASTQGRSEVNHSKQKPHAQKGTGKARQGFLGAPQYKGGGVVFGPKPKFDQHVRINQKERRAAVLHLIAEKIRDGHVIVLDDPIMAKPNTALLARFLRKLSWNKSALFALDLGLLEGAQDKSLKAFCLSVRNLPKIRWTAISNLNALDLANTRNFALTQSALNQLIARSGGIREPV